MFRRLFLLLFGAVLGLTGSRAWGRTIWPSNGEVVEAILRIWVPYVYEYYRQFKEYMKTSNEAMTDQKNAAFGKFGESIMNQRRDLYNSELARATEPPPRACSDKGVSEAGQKATDEAQISTRENTYGGDMDAAELTTQRRLRRRMTRVRSIPDPENGPDISLVGTPLSQPYGLPDDYDPYRFAQHLMGVTEGHAERLPPSLEGRKSSVLYEDLRAAHLSRLSLVRRTLQKAIVRRTPSPSLYDTLSRTAGAEEKATLNRYRTKNGISPVDILSYEVERFYGNDSFRSEVDSYANPVPLLKTLAALEATRGKLLYEIESMTRDRNLLLSGLALQRLDSRDNARRLSRLYVAASEPSSEIQKSSN